MVLKANLKTNSCSYIGNNLPNLLPNYNVTWNYSATSHGKGTVDGLGGTVKRMTTRKIYSPKAIIKDAKSFVETAQPEDLCGVFI